MTKLQRDAMEAARHELVTLDGPLAADGAAPGETWTIDTKATIAKLDAALIESAGSNKTTETAPQRIWLQVDPEAYTDEECNRTSPPG